MAFSTSWIVIRSRTTRSMRRRPMRNAFWMSSPFARIRRLPRWSMSSAQRRRGRDVELDEAADDGGDVLAGDGPAELRARILLARELDAHALGDGVELLVELVAPDAPEVVPAEVEEQAVDELAGVVAGGRVARAQLLVDLDEGLVDGLRQVLLEGRRDVLVVHARVDGAEERGDLVVRLVADGAEERRRRDLPLPVHLDREQVLVARLELEPCPAVGDDLRAYSVRPDAGSSRAE